MKNVMQAGCTPLTHLNVPMHFFIRWRSGIDLAQGTLKYFGYDCLGY
jgi:hypothetical protein